jgi:hypothetical protein
MELYDKGVIDDVESNGYRMEESSFLEMAFRAEAHF